MKKSAHFFAKAGVSGGDDKKCNGEANKDEIVHDDEKDGMLLGVPVCGRQTPTAVESSLEPRSA